MCTCVYVCSWMCVHVHVSACICECVHVCAPVSPWVCVCVCMCDLVRVVVGVRSHGCACTCACVCTAWAGSAASRPGYAVSPVWPPSRAGCQQHPPLGFLALTLQVRGVFWVVPPLLRGHFGGVWLESGGETGRGAAGSNACGLRPSRGSVPTAWMASDSTRARLPQAVYG